MGKLTDDTKALIAQQKDLMKQIDQATPGLNEAMKMMQSPSFKNIASGNSFKGMKGILDSLNGSFLGGGKKDE